MKKKNQRYIILTALIVLGMTVVVSHATLVDDQPDIAGFIRDKVVKRLTEELNLSPEQVSKIKMKSEADWKENKVIIDQVISKAKQLGEELEKERSDPDKIEALVQEINVLRGILLSKRIESAIAIKEILNPDQFVSLKEKLRERRQFRKGILKKWLENHIKRSI